MGKRPYPALLLLLLVFTIAPRARAQAPKECLASYEAAQRERLKHDLPAAKRELLVCSKPECPEVLRRDCSAWLTEVERSAQASIVVVARVGEKTVSDVTVTLDGKVLPMEASGTAIPVEVGRHRLEVESIDYDPVSVEFSVKAGETNKAIDVELHAPAPEPRVAERNLTPVYGLAALGAIGIGSFTFFGLRSHSRKNDLEDCKGHCADEDVDRVKRDQLVADVSLGVGLLCLGGATYLYLREPKRRETVRVGLGPHPSGVRAVVEGAF